MLKNKPTHPSDKGKPNLEDIEMALVSLEQDYPESEKVIRVTSISKDSSAVIAQKIGMSQTRYLKLLSIGKSYITGWLKCKNMWNPGK